LEARWFWERFLEKRRVATGVLKRLGFRDCQKVKRESAHHKDEEKTIKAFKENIKSWVKSDW